ncbi:hypothetical protein BDZ85DRAFT_281372 [Elsinoe ampelina]|uniref:Uncharacterized protein n=1 Tax=Elsinoe ampelina TaxID=302913 RepID=A0A6A6GD29_9PEZI|nr:hypothetical protein BDZ85DRAFT_281372 [Elsinoe ampelina]
MTPKLDCNDPAPTPFPADVPSIVLASVSIAKLLGRDKDEAFKITDIMGSTCFFTLDLLDHEKGIQLYKDITPSSPRFTRVAIRSLGPLEQQLPLRKRRQSFLPPVIAQRMYNSSSSCDQTL